MQWRQLLAAYFDSRPGVAGIVVVMDARHPLTPLDKQLLEWLGNRRRLFLLTAQSNLASQRLAERAGFVRVGTERASAETAEGGWEDNALYDRLRD